MVAAVNGRTAALIVLAMLCQAIDLDGEPGGTRTRDPMIKSHVLYRLSYGLHVQTRTMSHLRNEPCEYGQVLAVLSGV